MRCRSPDDRCAHGRGRGNDGAIGAGTRTKVPSAADHSRRTWGPVDVTGFLADSDRVGDHRHGGPGGTALDRGWLAEGAIARVPGIRIDGGIFAGWPFSRGRRQSLQSLRLGPELLWQVPHVHDVSADPIVPVTWSFLPMAARSRSQQTPVEPFSSGTCRPGGEHRVLHQSSPVVRIVFSPDGARPPRWSATSRQSLYGTSKPAPRRVLPDDTPGVIMALAFSPDGSMLATASALEHDVRLWDLKSGHVRRVLRGHEHP